MGLLVKNLLFAILLPGTVMIWIPWWILHAAHVSIQLTRVRWPALLPLAIGVTIVLRCIWDFADSGRGTLAPIDPPKNLVVRGPYRYVRNPMYIGVLLVVLSEAWLFRSGALLVEAGIAFLIIHTFVLLYEEPHLRRQFGASYSTYCRSVNRWLPRRPDSDLGQKL